MSTTTKAIGGVEHPLWSQFHLLWGRSRTGAPYDKAAWMLLQQLIVEAMQQMLTVEEIEQLIYEHVNCDCPESGDVAPHQPECNAPTLQGLLESLKAGGSR